MVALLTRPDTRPAPVRTTARPDPRDLRPPAVSAALAAVLAVAYLVSPLTGEDTSAQLARAAFARAHPLTPVDLRWFGGTVQFGYSLWAPWVAGLLGTKLAGALAAVASAWLATRLLQRARPARPMWGGIAVAVCQVTDVAVGRITYQLGVVCALGAVLALLGKRRGAAVVLAFLAGAASPVATLGLGVSAITAVFRRQVVLGAWVAVPSGVATAVVVFVFADGGTMTFAPESAIRAVLACLLVIALVPRRHDILRLGAAVNLAVVLVAWVVPSPIGANSERLSLLFAIPIIAACVEWRARWVGAAVVVVTLAQPPTMLDIARLAGVPATYPSYYRPLLAAIGEQGPLTGRVEVPEINGHWDAALLAGHVPIARGWLRQDDTKLNRDVFFTANGPTPVTYRDWLTRNAVQYVAVPDARLTASGRQERALVTSGLPYLHAVWYGRHWTLYAVQAATPIVAAPARLVSMDATRIVLTAPGDATTLIRIRWFAWTTLTATDGCIAPDRGQVLLHTGPHRATARYVISSSTNPLRSRSHCT